ncbi:MAG TPA: hypothetical protein VGD41_18835 [Pyrinomonadaceae bacterium]
MLLARTTLLIFLVVTFSACNDVSRERQSKALMNEATKLIQRDGDVTKQFADEAAVAFTPEQRAQFPANRDFLKTHAANIIKLLDESSSLNNRAAAKYEQAAGLSVNERQHKGMTMFADGFRKTVEINEIVKAMMQTISDERVVDQKTLNERFSQSRELVEQKRRERDESFGNAKQLMGL